MRHLASWIAAHVANRAAEARSSHGETRLIFHGPPLQLLDAVYEALSAEEDKAGVPIMLQVPALAPGCANPPVGQSGRCDENHLLDLRNSPSNPSYLALVPPGERAIMSVSSTTDEFGLSAGVDGSDTGFEQWWDEPFVQAVAAEALDRLGLGPERSQAETLLNRAASAVDANDAPSGGRAAVWRLLSRVFDIPSGALDTGIALSAACGVPPTGDGRLSADEQQASLDMVASALADGFRAGLRPAMEAASEDQARWLAQFLDHIRATCSLPTALERGAEPFYLPHDDYAFESPPEWWRELTIETWAALLAEEPEVESEIALEVENALLPPTRGVPVVVSGSVDLIVRAGGRDGEVVQAVLERSPGKASGGFPMPLAVEGSATASDGSPPPHKSPLQYKASAEHHRPARTKVISLASWSPGFLVVSRQARKVVPPRAPTGRARGAAYETSLTMPGPGRYELLVLCSPGVRIAPVATGSGGDGTAEEQETSINVREVKEGWHQLEVEVDGSYQIDLTIEGSAAGKGANGRVFLSCDDVVEDGCRSEFERLIKINRRQFDGGASKPVIQLDRTARTSMLQGWLVQDAAAERSFLPIALADDYSNHWSEPDWSSEHGRVFSAGRYLTDPRPPASQFDPPVAFVEARVAIASMIRGDDQTGLVEAAPLGGWLRGREDFPALLEQYLDAYSGWLGSQPEMALWADITCIASLEPGGRTIARVPDAILLSPLHPLRLGWHAVAQGLLDQSAITNRPCPAAGILDPGSMPDVMHLPILSPGGVEQVAFLAVDASSDYWSVLWNGARLASIAERGSRSPFGPALGLSVGGISTGFSASQVTRALDDVANVLCAKPSLAVHVSSAGGSTPACNEGLVGWSTSRFSGKEGEDKRHWLGSRRLDIFDGRQAPELPEASTIANLSEDTGNAVRWFVKPVPPRPADLGIIAQLETSEPEATTTEARSPVSAGAMLRSRIRRQLPGSFLLETRQCLAPPVSGDVLADKVGALAAAVENSSATIAGLRFAPDIHAVSELLEGRTSNFAAISSSAVDPACFLGDMLPSSYLWDFDLPSYSHRAGDTNGYYLLSRINAADRDRLRNVLGRLPDGDALADQQVNDILLEVARRGIPTIRGLSGDDTGATGDLGLFIAARLLQDRFRLTGSADSLTAVVGASMGSTSIALVIPVDPFRGFLDDLSRALGRDRVDASLSRPDLLVVSANFGEHVRIHLTPIEVKCRLGSILSQADAEAALSQARALATLLATLKAEADPLSMWRLAYQHLLLSFIGFGMRVYSQHRDIPDASAWSACHQRMAEAVLADPSAITVDPRGRLVVVDDSVVSDAVDRDRDGFEETIVIGARDAARVVAGEAQPFYEGVKAKVAGWGLAPGEGPFTEPVPVSSVAPGSDMSEQPPEPASGPAGGQGAADTGQSEPAVETPNPAAAAAGGERTLLEGGRGVVIEVGTTVDGFEQRCVSLALSDTRLNQLNMGVVGDLGTGKTQLLKSLVQQVTTASPSNRGIRPRMLVFDYKRDYSDPEFVEAAGARVAKPYRLPLNLFDTTGLSESMVPWLDRFRFFADVLDKIYSGIGPVQRDKLKRAVRGAYEATGGRPTIYDVHSAYAELLDGKSDSPMSIIDDLVDMEIFEPDLDKCVPFDHFLDGVVVISLDLLGQDDRSKNMLVAVMLNMFYENMLRTPKRPFLGTEPQLRAIDSYLLVDEADNIMRYEFDVLRKLLLQGREFGCGVILASQYLRHFKVNATDYREPLLTWFIHKVPSILPAELQALGLGAGAGELAERVKALGNHQCLYKSFDVPGRIVRGLPFYELQARKALA